MTANSVPQFMLRRNRGAPATCPDQTDEKNTGDIRDFAVPWR
jgi:hypothetical protein